MLDRPSLEATDGLSDALIEEIMVNAVKGIVLLSRSESSDLLKQLSQNDRSLKVRQAALEALQYQKK